MLHFGNLVADILIRGHKGTRPGRRILDEGARKRDAACVRVADGMRDARIWDARDVVHILRKPPLLVNLRKQLTVPVAHNLYVFALIVGVRIAVIGPQEGANPHFLPRGRQRFKALRRDLDNLARAKLIGIRIAKLMIGKGFKGNAAAVLALPNEYRQAAQTVTRRDYRILR